MKYKKYLPIIFGGAVGYAYYYFIGCYNGTCIIQSNPYISTLYGALFGAVFAFPFKAKKISVEEKKD